MGIRKLTIDTNDCEQAVLALQATEKKYRELFEETKDAVFISSPQGRYLDMNPAGVELFGYASKEELLLVDIARDIYVNADARGKFQSVLEKHGFVKDYELLLKRKDGVEINSLVTANAVLGDDGTIGAYRGIIRDVTNQRRLEAQLIRAHKMEAIGQLSSGVAHDFNNILTAIMGYASLLKAKTKEDATLQSFVQQILAASTRAKGLTQNLLAFSGKTPVYSVPVQINEIIQNLERMLIQLIQEDIEFKTVLAEEVMTIIADRGQLEQVLVNLVANARDAMPQGGTLTLATKRVDMGEEQRKRQLIAKHGVYVCISLTDTGAGMDEKTREKIFDPFFTTKDVGDGTGLGLAFVASIVHQHNGELHVASVPGQGTTFRMYFPLVEPQLEDNKQQEALEPIGGTETLLLAEDDVDVRSLAKTILTDKGYTVLEAVDGEDAVRVFSENKDAIRLVLLDVIMPKKNGKEVHNIIKKIKSGTTVLFMSGYSPDVIFRKGVYEEGLNLISKPATPHELLRKVRELLDKQAAVERVMSTAAPISPTDVPVVALASEIPSASIALVKHEGSIIVVDDDPHVLEYVLLLLEEQGYTTHACSNGRDAVEILKEQQADVILTDIVMPGMSGLELLETVHSIDPDMPVILVTAFADLGKAVESIKKGAYDFIMKPYDPEQLVRALDKAVRYRTLVRLEKEYQGKLEEFNKQMETLVAERSMNLMALTVADRVRNPATVIALACKKILGKDVPADLKKYVSFIREESDKLEAMVKSFQDLLGARRSVFVCEDINEVVNTIIPLIEKESTAKGVTLVQHQAGQPLKMQMQENLMRVAIQHVLRNAVEATPAHGQVTITTSSEKDKVVLTIEDTGTGIPASDLERVFDPFYSTKEHRYGTGLPLIKQVVSEHMGEIDLKSELGKGTIFRMIFPTHWQEQ
jgi:PAS domain S-box-containing protein